MRIELESVSKAYGATIACRDLDLEIGDGEFRVLLGPSGCGKSTALRLIAGLEKPTLGRVIIDGDDAAGIAPGDREVAFAFQEHALYPKMTVRENLEFPLRMAGMCVAEVTGRVDDVARRLRLAEVLDVRPSKLSGGQQQRVSLGRSVIRRPRAFLMDEPLSNLDTHLRHSARSLIAGIQRRGPTTAVFVTHDQEEAMTLGDRITVMRNGRAVQTSTPRDLYDHPVDVFTARFVGSPPMNLYLADVVADADERSLQLGSAIIPLPRSTGAGPASLLRPNEPVIVGFRAEALHRHPDGELCASVCSTELLGPEQLVHAVIDAPSIALTADGHRIEHRRESAITMWAPPRASVGLWKPLPLRVDVTQLHFFDHASGLALRADPLHSAQADQSRPVMS